ncbi:MAG: hypothetical protein JW941_09615 [Candidatus Coatesbacteria bacterium]|nr:hypothetical protein [Candidatus Coatesbacteria bacterium]
MPTTMAGMALFISAGFLLFVHALCLRIKVKRLVALSELAIALNGLALVAWRVYAFLIGYRLGLEPPSAMAGGAVLIVYVAAVRLISERKMGLLVWISLPLLALFSVTFLLTQESSRLPLPNLGLGPSSISTQELERQRVQNEEYLRFIEISGVKCEFYEDTLYGHSVYLECEVRNMGDQNLGTLTLSGSLLNKNGDIVAQDEFYPVSKNAPLGAGKKHHVMSRFSIMPDTWDGKSIDVRITELRLARNLMISTASFPTINNSKKAK